MSDFRMVRPARHFTSSRKNKTIINMYKTKNRRRCNVASRRKGKAVNTNVYETKDGRVSTIYISYTLHYTICIRPSRSLLYTALESRFTIY